MLSALNFFKKRRVNPQQEKRYRLLQIIPSLDIGGAEKLVVELAKNINGEEFQVGVCVFGGKLGTFLEDELAKNNIPTIFLDITPGKVLHLLTILRLFNVFSIFKPDIIHTHLLTLRYVLIPAKLARIPVHIHTIHNLAWKDTPYTKHQLLNKITFKFLGVKPVSVSKFVARTVKGLYGVESVVIYNGISTEEYSMDYAKSPHGEICLLNIGRFKEQKNHLLLIDAFAKAVKKEPRLKLILVGDGELRWQVEEKVKQRDLEGKVDFLGWRSDIPYVLSNSDIFVLSSDWEGFPIVLIEAMAAGKPVVATKVGGVPEGVEDGVTGLLVPPRDADALAEAILKLAEDEELRREMGEKGKERAISRFDIHYTVREHERLYKEELLRRTLWKRRIPYDDMVSNI